MLDARTHGEVEAAWQQFKLQMERLNKEVEEAWNQYEGPNANHGQVEGDGQAAYEHWKRKKTEHEQRRVEVEQKKNELRREWDRFVTSKGLPPRFSE